MQYGSLVNIRVRFGKVVNHNEDIHEAIVLDILSNKCITKNAPNSALDYLTPMEFEQQNRLTLRNCGLIAANATGDARVIMLALALIAPYAGEFDLTEGRCCGEVIAYKVVILVPQTHSGHARRTMLGLDTSGICELSRTSGSSRW